MMSQSDLIEFLSQPLLARIATVRRDDSPHVVPVWFGYDGQALLISTPKTTVKVANLRRDPGVAVTIDSTEGGFRNKRVILEGIALIEEANATETSKQIFKKYLTPDEMSSQRTKERLDKQRVIIRVKPKNITSYDYRKTLSKT